MFRQTPVVPPMVTRRATTNARRPASETDPEEGRSASEPPPLPPIELGPIIKAKIQPPALRSSTLSRQRLIDRLQEATTHRLTLLIAEAGYGKTTLLASYERVSDKRIIWYRLDPSDADAVTWANHIIAAAREVEPEFGQATLRLMSQMATGGPPKSRLVSSVIGELSDLRPVPTVLVLDDYQAVDEATEAIEFATRLIRDAPPWLHIVLSSRTRPTLELGRLKVSDDVAEFTTDDLRFSPDETLRLFADCYETPLDEDVLLELDSRAQGWAASLQLFHGSIRGRPQSAVRVMARALSGASGPIYDFLAEEVLANLPQDLERFLVRSCLLNRIRPNLVVALFSDSDQPTTTRTAEQWIDDADRLALLSRSSETSDARQLHPLLKDFLFRHLQIAESEEAIRKMHFRVARSVAATEPLTATHHFLEAGEDAEAARCLGSSLLMTMGSGQSGVASDLVNRMPGVLTDPAVAAIRARRLLERGELSQAARLLEGVDLRSASTDVRAVVRHTRLALGWRNGDRDLMFATLREIQDDPNAPATFADIFQVNIDTSPLASRPVSYEDLVKRLERMAISQQREGQTYYAAISLHNAATTALVTGDYSETRRLGYDALVAFEAIPHVDFEKYSTHAMLAITAFELGEREKGEEHLRTAVSSGDEHGDVAAECAYTLSLMGEVDRASSLLLSARELARKGRSDVTAALFEAFARAMLGLSETPNEARMWLNETPEELPLDTGYVLERQMLTALSYVVSGQISPALDIATDAVRVAETTGARRLAGRLGIIKAISQADPDSVRRAVAVADSLGELALLTTADALAEALWLVPEVPSQIRGSIGRWPRRWLPLLRRQLKRGGTANGVVAAKLLDEFGELQDLPLLKAYGRAYRRATRGQAALGVRLTGRVAPPLRVSDLGRTELSVGDRSVAIGAIRRKAAALLMFLVTRPGFVANREQTVEELWPESDPDAGSNNLNQSLYYLRREIDPWFEDDLSIEYVAFQGDLVWLDPNLTRASSVEFAIEARKAVSQPIDVEDAVRVLSEYRGQFAPEFEYDEWASSWRTRVHALFLELANTAIRHAIGRRELGMARDIALLALDRDPAAVEIEQKLVYLYWHLGSTSAAVAQHEHLASAERRDGLEITPLQEIVRPDRF